MGKVLCGKLDPGIRETTNTTQNKTKKYSGGTGFIRCRQFVRIFFYEIIAFALLTAASLRTSSSPQRNTAFLRSPSRIRLSCHLP